MLEAKYHLCHFCRIKLNTEFNNYNIETKYFYVYIYMLLMTKLS